MSEYLLHESFFKKNPLEKVSAAVIADFALTTMFNDGLNEEMEKVLNSKISDVRKTQINEDKAVVEQIKDGEDVVTYMRKNHDNIADSVFYRKAMEFEAEAAPLIVKRYKTTAMDRFVEHAFRILAKADKKYTEQLFREYQEIRNPYAKSMACLLFGEQRIEEALPLLLKEYERFKEKYPDESFHQAPLLAIYILFGKA